MKMYDIRIWGKKSQRDFVSFKCFSDCIPFELNSDHNQNLIWFNEDQNNFLKKIIELIYQKSEHFNPYHEPFFDVYSDRFWLKDINDIHIVYVTDVTNTFHTVSVKDLKKDS